MTILFAFSVLWVIYLLCRIGWLKRELGQCKNDRNIEKIDANYRMSIVEKKLKKVTDVIKSL